MPSPDPVAPDRPGPAPGASGPVDPAARDRLALALDVDDAVAAQRLARELRPWFSVAKVGLELFSAAGPDIIQELVGDGYRVFADLKMADIPTTVHRAARVLGALGVSYVTFHAFVGPTVLRAGVEGLEEGAAAAGLPAPATLAVTILTSDRDAPAHILGQRVETALEAHCAGVICAAADVREVKLLGPRLLAVVPGIRPAGSPIDDQARPVTPAGALAEGADLLVVGRAVTAATDRAAAASALVASLGRP
jgi:orotidine-5'-phosphate decarboxylase